MSISREEIVSTLRAWLEPDESVLAMWLEGADATGYLDEYSDIDLCCSVIAGSMQRVTAKARSGLERLGRLDLVDTRAVSSDMVSSTFHLEGTLASLLVDFDVFVGRGSSFTEGDPIEKPLILFDRGEVITFTGMQEQLAKIDQAQRLDELSKVVSQYARIEKYIRRGEFLEAFGYYHKWLLSPLIEALRMRFTPLHSDYYIVHISRHLPEGILHRLEDLFQVSSLAELEEKSRSARDFFYETAAFLGMGRDHERGN